jgi:hypothetical protein
MAFFQVPYSKSVYMQNSSYQADDEQLKQEVLQSLARAVTLSNRQNSGSSAPTDADPENCLQKFNRLIEKRNFLTRPCYPDPLLIFPREIWQECLLQASMGITGGLLNFIEVNQHWTD